MAEAAITLKLTPKEFDLLRRVLRDEREHLRETFTQGPPEGRSEKRQREAQIAHLLERLQ